MAPNNDDVKPIAHLAAVRDEKAKLAKEEDTPPSPRTFLFSLMNDEIVEQTGFLIATPSFVGVGELDGTILAVFNLDNLRYAIVKNDQKAAAAA